MSVKTTVVTAAAVATLGLGAVTALTPQTPAEQFQDRVGQASDSVEKTNDDVKKLSEQQAEAERLRRLVPSELRPVRPRIRVWWP